MRRIARLDKAIGQARPSAYTTSLLCSTCRHQTAPFSSSLRHAAGKASLAERLRSRVWGTSQPPGIKNPYGKPEEDEVVAQEKEIELAERKKQEEAMMETYVPATSWDGLESVGGWGNWWKQNWDPEHQFQGFLPAYRATDSYEITAALHRSLVEVFALQQAGKPIAQFSQSIGPDMTTVVQIAPSANGATLHFGDVSAEEIIQSLAPVEEAPTQSEADVKADRSLVDPLHPDITESEGDVATERSPEDPGNAVVDETAVKENPTDSEADVAADRSMVDPLAESNQAPEAVDHQRHVASWDPTWPSVPLNDPAIKFAVFKRVLQLTGIRISDAALNSVHSAQSLLSQLITPPKPRKVVEALAQNEKFAELPNVRFSSRRITPIDKEISVGRWKVIEKELESRGLPVTGHRL